MFIQNLQCLIQTLQCLDTARYRVNVFIDYLAIQEYSWNMLHYCIPFLAYFTIIKQCLDGSNIFGKQELECPKIRVNGS